VFPFDRVYPSCGHTNNYILTLNLNKGVIGSSESIEEGALCLPERTRR
jgi:hypothetical protein